MGDSTDEPAPADVFGLLANETRMAIIRALADGPGTESEPGFGTTLGFSELRDVVGLRDSGQFNYHLDKLRGRFVVETDGGYTLTYTGGLLYRLVAARRFAPETEIEPFDAGATCIHCATPLEASYDEAVFRIDCPDCGREYMSWTLPPSATDEWEAEQLLSTFDQFIRTDIQLLNQDVCVWCGGHMPPSIETRTATEFTGGGSEIVLIERRCDNCGEFLVTTAGERVLYHPATVSFFYEHGVDVTQQYLWDLDFVVDQSLTTVRSEDPWEIVVTLSCAGATRRLVLDGDATVTAVEV